jgi:hypothetical protein
MKRTLLDDLDAFYQEHRRCGELETGVGDERLWMTCTCGARIVQLLGRAANGSAQTVEYVSSNPR